MNEQYTGSRISQARKEKGWTQKQLADQLHVSIAAVSKWERGLNYPDISLLQPLAKELDISAAELLGIENESAENAVQTIAQISADEKQKENKEKRIRFIVFIGSIISAVLSSILILIIGSSDQIIPSIGFMKTLFHTGLLNIAAICSGLLAWGFGLFALFSAKKTYTICSLLFCGFSVYIPTLITDLQIRFGDFAALADTAWGYNFAAIVLLIGTVLLNSFNVIHILQHTKKEPSAIQTEQ